MMQSAILRRFIGLLCAAGPFTGSLAAQERFTTSAAYAVAFPTSGTRHFVTAPSWAGITYEGRWALSDRRSAAIGFGLHDFSNQSFGTTNFPSGAATGQQLRDLLMTHVNASLRYYPLPAAQTRPFVSMGAAAVYSEQYYSVGLSSFHDHDITPALMPEIGLELPYMEDIDAVVSLRYSLPVSRRHLGGSSSSFQFFAISIGLIER
jgi:hypothetical protein